MMDCTYYLTQNLSKRNAANLIFSLKEINSSVFLYRANDRRVNGKSLIGILSGRFLQGDTIKILIDNPEQMSRVKSIFNQYGEEII